MNKEKLEAMLKGLRNVGGDAPTNILFITLLEAILECMHENKTKIEFRGEIKVYCKNCNKELEEYQGKIV